MARGRISLWGISVDWRGSFVADGEPDPWNSWQGASFPSFRTNNRKRLMIFPGNFFKPESRFFYTLHKCASVLFGKFILPNVNGLTHINYGSQVFRGELSNGDKVKFRKRGFVYGPIRVSNGLQPTELFCRSNVYRDAANPNFVRDKISVFRQRPPRYFGFGILFFWFYS